MPRSPAAAPDDEPAPDDDGAAPDADAEAAFETIAQTAMSDAAAVKCSGAEYRDGLLHIIGSLRTALEAAEHDQ